MIALACAAPERPAGDHESLSAILKLEDRRSTGGGALQGYLDSTHPLHLRVRAALAIGRIGAPVTGPEDLRDALRDPAPELRRMSAFAIGEIDDAEAGAPPLLEALGDEDAQVRALAAEALGKLKAPGAVKPLRRLLEDPDPGVAGMALLALWKIEPAEDLFGQIAKAREIYETGSAELRWKAGYFLMRLSMGHAEEPGIEAALLEQVEDPDPLIRSFAARGLGASLTNTATAALLRLAADADWRVRVNAFNGLGQREVPSAVAGSPVWPRYAAGLADEDKGVRLAALAALASCKPDEARRSLVDHLGHEHRRFREVALVALAAREKQEALPFIEPLASDPEWSVRARLTEALGAIESPRAGEILRDLSTSTDARVRGGAARNLGVHRERLAPLVLPAALEDEDLFVRAAALESMGSREAAAASGRDPVEILRDGYLRAMEDPLTDARLAAVEALAALASDAAREAIEQVLEDPDYLVRKRAAEALRKTFQIDRLDRVGEPPPSRSDEEYLEIVRRAKKKVSATFETDSGRVEIELYPEDAPLTVDNFMRLAREGRLDGTAFHRVVPNFVIQDGDPRGDGNGGPPWQIRCEINQRRYGEGAVGMALAGKDTGGSQYFMTHSPQPHLDGGYTIFGQVVSGQEVVNRMVQGDGVRKVTITESDRP